MVRKMFKQILGSAIAIAFLTFVMTGTGLAQAAPSSPNSTDPLPAGPQGVAEQTQMDHYLENHPKTAEELHADPSLINNPQWLKAHPAVGQWMAQHPTLRSAAMANPTSIVNRTESHAINDAQHEVRTTDAFLSKNPKMAEQLAKDPNLINNKEYLAQHPGLENYLKTHPGTASEWQKHPEQFTQVAERYGRQEEREKQHPHSATQPHPVAHAPAAHTKGR
jgi:hypothetical protein